MFDDFTSWGGRFGKLGNAALAGLRKAKVPPDQIESVLGRFFGAPEQLVKCTADAEAFALTLFPPKPEIPPAIPMAQVTEPVAGMRIDMGDGWVFTVGEVISLEVDGSIKQETIVEAGGHQVKDWPWLGEKFWIAGTRTVKAVLGWLSQNWTDEIVGNLLKKPGCRFKGSGAWVREAFLVARPRYDGNGWIGFVADPASRWQFVLDRRVYFPDLWHDGCGWDRDFDSVRDEYDAVSRLCLLWE